MVIEKFIIKISQFKQKKLDDSDDDSEESGYEEVILNEYVLNEDVFYDVLSLTVAGRDEELGNIMNSERWIMLYDVTYVEIFNITNIEIRKKVIDILLSEITDGLLDEIIFGLDFDCEVFRSRLKTIINKSQNEEEGTYETHDEESDENED